MELFGPMDFIISSWECQGFSMVRFGEGLSDTRFGLFHEHGTINHLGSIHLSYVWLCNWEHPFSAWPEGKSLRALHIGQTLHWRVALIRCGIMRFLCAPATQLEDQPCTTLNFAISSEIHHQKPQPTSFSHIGWSELLPTNYKAR
jgi:hypothetical protein